jgi:putative oxygen-independent coproporphyrinogen III oxidase
LRECTKSGLLMSPSAPPDGELAPADGALPDTAFLGSQDRTWSLYIHIPFCAVRCGYCDFNTYTSDELSGVSHGSYPVLAAQEMDLAASVMRGAPGPKRALSSVFFGGGTPTLLGPQPLVALLNHARDLWGLASGAEVTVEANPDSVTEEDILALKEGGVTRISLGVQSTDPEVLRTLDRTHNPDHVPRVVSFAQQAGLEVSVDLIFGSPRESLKQWQKTVGDALALGPDHISAYSLIVEPGTALARRIARGELPMVDDDVQADMYSFADEAFSAAGYHWYEISNWSKDFARESVHNRSYWTTQDWWGVGPGAHSHVGGVRWWNVKHPAAYAKRIDQGRSPALAREILTPAQQQVERVLLGVRMREGIPVSWVGSEHSTTLATLVGWGFIDGHQLLSGRIVLTKAGRLVADHVVRELT